MAKTVRCWFCDHRFTPTVGIGPTGCPECGQPNFRPAEYWMKEDELKVEVAKHERFTREQVKQAVQNELTERFVTVGGMFSSHVDAIADSIISRLV